MAELHETLMGRKLIEQVFPDIAENLGKIAIAIQQQTFLSKQNTIESTEHNDNGMTILESYIYSFLSDFFINVFLLVSLIFSIVCMIYWYQYSLTINSIKCENTRAIGKYGISATNGLDSIRFYG